MANFDPYAQDEAKIARQQRMADMLTGQSMQPIDQFSYQGIPAPISPAAGLAKMLMAWGGRRKADAADKGLADINQRRGADVTADYSSLADAMRRKAVPEQELKGDENGVTTQTYRAAQPGGMQFSDVAAMRSPEGRQVALSEYDNQLQRITPQNATEFMRNIQYINSQPQDKQAALWAALTPSLNRPYNLGDAVATNGFNPDGTPRAPMMAMGAAPKIEVDKDNNRVIDAPAIVPDRPGVPGNVPAAGQTTPIPPSAPPGPQAQAAPGTPTVQQLPPTRADQTKVVAAQSAFDNLKAQTQLQLDALDHLKATVAAHSTQAQFEPWGAAHIPFAFGAAKEMDADLTKINASNFLSALSQLKQASPNGASGLGATTLPEQQALASQFANLNPAAPGFAQRVDILANELKRQIAQAERVTAQDRGIALGAGPTATSGGRAAPAPGTIEGGYRFKGGNPADPANWEQVR